MSTPDIDVIKEIPGYKVILKAVLKMQIQQLVEHLASHTDEESVILTASVSDGTLSHLGSDSGKNFLDDHEDIKSQFLGFCLKRHHKKKQQEKEKEAEAAAIAAAALVSPHKMGGMQQMRYGGPRYGSPRMPMRSPTRFASHGGIHPVALSRAGPPHMRSPGARHEPYPMTRPQRRPSLNYDQPGAMRLPLGGRVDNQVIKIEPDGDSNGSDSKPTDSSATSNVPSSSQPASPSQNTETSNTGDKDDEATNSSTASTIPNESSELKFSDTQPAEGLSLDSDLSNLISTEAGSPHMSSDNLGRTGASGSQSDSGEPDVNVKVEAITESEMELEITGVELGHSSAVDPMRSPETWGQQGGATGSPGDMQGYRNVLATGKMRPKFPSAPEPMSVNEEDSGSVVGDFEQNILSYTDILLQNYPSKTSDNPFLRHHCHLCGKKTGSPAKLKIHMRTHTGEKPYKCDFCSQCFANTSNMYQHIRNRHNSNFVPKT